MVEVIAEMSAAGIVVMALVAEVTLAAMVYTGRLRISSAPWLKPDPPVRAAEQAAPSGSAPANLGTL